MTTLEILREARAFHAEGPHRWCQGKMFDGNAMCMWGLISLTAETDAARTHAWRPVLDAVAPNEKHPSVVLWQDAPGRTYAEIMAAWDRAIASEEAKEQSS